MRHRLVTNTGLGNPTKEILNNKWTGNTKLDEIIREMAQEAIGIWFNEHDWLDFSVEYDQLSGWAEVSFGYEPAYQRERLKIIVISTNETASRWEKGIAWGAYGSEIVKNTKAAYEYKYNSKFKRFADKWSKKLKEVVANGTV